jgi:hypothetical protein
VFPKTERDPCHATESGEKNKKTTDGKHEHIIEKMVETKGCVDNEAHTHTHTHILLYLSHVTDIKQAAFIATPQVFLHDASVIAFVKDR